MTRIGTLGANTAYVDRILDIQSRISTEQVQVSTGLKSETYDGIAAGANTVINFENESALAQRFIDNNSVWATKLSAASTAASGIQKTLTNFQKALTNYQQNSPKNQLNVKTVQNAAFQTMQDIQAYLATNVNGQYLFSGGRVSTVPVQLPAASLSAFQTIYDGSINTAATTRTADLQHLTLTNKETTALSFNAASGTIVPTKSDAFTQIYAGSRITVAGSTSSPSNNGNLTIKTKAVCNTAGTPLGEGQSTTNVITYGTSTTTNITATALNPLTFKFAPDGTLNMTATTAGTLSNLTVGAKFTIAPPLANGSATTGYEGSYKVLSNVNGVVNFTTDLDTAQTEAVANTAITFAINGAAAAHPATAGTLNFTTTTSAVTGKTTSTLSAVSPPGTDFSGVAVGDQITLAGTADHNGTFTVTSKGAGGSSMSFTLNPEGARVAQFLPQSGRIDATLSYTDGSGATVNRGLLDYGSLQFASSGTTGERITSANANGFLDSTGNPAPPIGAVMTIKSTSGVNDGVYKITANNGNYVEVQSVSLGADALSTTSSMSSNTWYQGDTLQLQHRVDTDRTVDVGIYASDPAFEKAIRGLSLIAQGVFGTAGGLDAHPERISQALYLINDAIESPASGTPPFGAEKAGDIKTVSANIGSTQSIISQKNDKHNQFITFLNQRVIDIAQVDKTTAVTTLLSDQTALQGSYQALAQVHSLSLLNFLK
ncbi:MAG: hypothetical protein HY055_14335 [Magnetospirillum sp.]|nr:hypothetical protein [Magnetospirillum sp.]